MANETMSTFDAILKLDYLPVLQAQFNKEVILYNRIKRDRENVVGKSYNFPVHSAWGETTGAIAEDGVIATPGTEDTLLSTGTVRTVVGRFGVSTKVIAATKSDKGAFVKAVDWKLKNVAENIKKDLNFMVNSDGSGALAKLTSDDSGQTFTVESALNLRPNMVINAWDARTAGNQHNGDATISMVDGLTVTVVGTIGAFATSDYLFKSMGRGINVMGLLGIVDDGTYVPTLQGIVRASYPFWKANVLGNSGTGRDLTLPLLQQAEDVAYIAAGGKISAFYSNLGQRLNYQQLVQQDRRYINTMKFDAGYEALEYNGKPWFIDRDAERKVIFALDESMLRFFMLSELDWMDEDGAILHRGSNLSYEATMEGHFELGSYQPNRHTVIRDLNEPAGY